LEWHALGVLLLIVLPNLATSIMSLGPYSAIFSISTSGRSELSLGAV